MAKKKFCIMCKKPAVEGSKLCKEHHQQAAMFTTSIVGDKPEEDAASPDPSGNGDEPKKAKSKAKAKEDGGAEESASAKPLDPWSPAGISETLKGAMSSLMAWTGKQEKSARRWPKLVVYALQNGMHARHHYGVVPQGKKREPAMRPKYHLTDEAVLSATQPGGLVFENLREQVALQRNALMTRDTKMVSVSFLTHMGVIIVGAENRKGENKEITRYEVAGGKLKAAEEHA